MKHSHFSSLQLSFFKAHLTQLLYMLSLSFNYTTLYMVHFLYTHVILALLPNREHCQDTITLPYFPTLPSNDTSSTSVLPEHFLHTKYTASVQLFSIFLFQCIFYAPDSLMHKMEFLPSLFLHTKHGNLEFFFALVVSLARKPWSFSHSLSNLFSS